MLDRNIEMDDLDFLDDNGDEWMKVEDHEAILENFKENAQIFFKELFDAMQKKDEALISDAIDNLADLLEVSI